MKWRGRAAAPARHRSVCGDEAVGHGRRAAADAELAAADPLPDNRYKVILVRNLIVTMLTELAERTE